MEPHRSAASLADMPGGEEPDAYRELPQNIDAEQALRMGLVTRVVAPGELMPTVRRMADHLAAFAPMVPRFMKAMIHSGMEGSMAAGLALEKFAQGALCETEDKAEGINAFLEKRDPKWKGK